MTTKSVTLSKALLGVVMALGLCVAFATMSPAKAQAAQEDGNLVAGSPTVAAQATYGYTVGSVKTGTVTSDADLYYSFNVGSATGIDAYIKVRNSGDSNSDNFYADLLDSSGSRIWETSSIYPGEVESASRIYLPKGNYRLKIYTPYAYYFKYSSKFSFKIAKQSQALKFAAVKKKATTITRAMKLGTEKEVALAYSSSDGFAEKNLKIVKNTQPKVASASLSDIGNGTATLTVTPKKMGVTKIKVKMGNKALVFVASVKDGYAYIAKGAVSTLEKPIGASKVKFVYKKSGAAKSKKVAGLANTGKIRGKAQGRAAIAAKTAKGTVFSYTVVVTDYKKLGRETYKLIQEYVPDPDSVKINYCYRGYYKVTTDVKVPVVYLDYSFANESGGKTRNKIISWYDDALDVQTRGMTTSNTIIGKKAFSFR